MNIIKSFSFQEKDKPYLEEFENIAKKEGLKFSELVVKCIRDYAVDHKEGNPQFTLDQTLFGDIKARPAFGKNRDLWIKHLNSQSDKVAEEILGQASMIFSRAKMRVKYGKAEVIES